MSEKGNFIPVILNCNNYVTEFPKMPPVGNALQHDPCLFPPRREVEFSILESGEGCDCFNQWGTVKGTVCDFWDQGIRGHASSALPAASLTLPECHVWHLIGLWLPYYLEVNTELRQEVLWSAAAVWVIPARAPVLWVNVPSRDSSRQTLGQPPSLGLPTCSPNYPHCSLS